MSGSTAVWWDENMEQRGRACAGSELSHWCKHMTDSCQLGGRNARCVCRVAVHTRSLMEELRKHQWKTSTVCLYYTTSWYMLCSTIMSRETNSTREDVPTQLMKVGNVAFVWMKKYETLQPWWLIISNTWFQDDYNDLSLDALFKIRIKWRRYGAIISYTNIKYQFKFGTKRKDKLLTNNMKQLSVKNTMLEAYWEIKGSQMLPRSQIFSFVSINVCHINCHARKKENLCVHIYAKESMLFWCKLW